MTEEVGYRLERENGSYRLRAVTLGDVIKPYSRIGLTDILFDLKAAVDANTKYHQQRMHNVKLPLDVNAAIRQLYDFALEALQRENIVLSIGLIKRGYVEPIAIKLGIR